MYLISALGGTESKRMFDSVSEIFGVFPISVLLLFATSIGNHIFQVILRWMALFIFLSSFFLLIVLDVKHVDQDTAMLITKIIHWGLTVVVLLGLLIRTASGKVKTK